MPIAEDSAGGSPVPIPTNLTTNLTGEATGSGTLDYTTGDIDIAVTVVDNGHNHILSNITDVQVNNAISGQILVYNGTVWANATNTSGITAIVQDLTPQLGGNLDLNNRNITGTGNIAITGTIDGRDVSADGTKLDGIESGATADQTAAQIKTAYESNANTNNFADADVSKLSGIEPGATADQTAAQIKTAYESNADTNAFTDADHTKLDGIETSADVTDTTNVVASLTAGTNVTISAGGVISSTASGGLAHVVDDTTPQLGGNLDLNSNDITGTGNLNFTGNVTLSGTVDGRDVASDGTKLDGIEASADVTDTANVTAAGALMDSEVTNLAQVKAFDSSDYATAAQGTTADAALPKAGGTMTGDILFNDGIKAKFGTSSDLQIWHNGTDSYVYDTGAGDLILRGSSNIKLQSAAGTALSTFTAAGASTLYYSAAEKLATTSTGIDVTGNIDLPDNGKLLLGASDDLQLYHDGTHNWIRDVGTGALFLDTNSAIHLYANGSENMLYAQPNAGVQVFYDNVKKLETTSTGIDVTGNILSNTGRLGLGTTNPAHEIHIESTSPTIRLVDTDGSNALEITQSGSASYLTFDNNMRFRNASAVEKLRIDSDGIDVTGVTKTSGSGYNPANTGWATNASLITSGSYGGGLTFLDGSAGYSIRVENSGADLVIGQGATSGALTQKVKINSSGLDVTGATNTTGTQGTRQWSAGSAGQKLGIYSYENSTFYHRLETGNATNYQWGAYDNIPIYTITNNTIRTTLLGNGNFGVGVTAPAYKIDVRGDANTDVAIQVKATGTGDVDADLRLDAADTGESVLRMMRNGVTRARVEFTSNELNITTDESGSHIDMQPDGTRVMRFESDNIEAVKVITCERSGVSESTMISFENDNGQVGKITSSGLGTVYGTTSDYRLKTDAQPMLNSIDRIKTLNPINFEWISDGSRVDGFLAHELQSIVPEAVIGTHDGMQDEEYVVSEATGDIYTPAVEATYDEQDQMLTPAVDEIIHSTDALKPDEYKEGQTWRETTERIMATRQVPDYQNIDQSKLVPLLTSALQDAIAKIEALETRLEALES